MAWPAETTKTRKLYKTLLKPFLKKKDVEKEEKVHVFGNNDGAIETNETEQSVLQLPESEDANAIAISKEDLRKKVNRFDIAMNRLRRMVGSEHEISNDPSMTELFVEGCIKLLVELDSNTSFVEEDLCRHIFHSNVTNLPQPIFQEFGVGGNNTFDTFSPFLASNLVQVKPFRFHNKNVENFQTPHSPH